MFRSTTVRSYAALMRFPLRQSIAQQPQHRWASTGSVNLLEIVKDTTLSNEEKLDRVEERTRSVTFYALLHRLGLQNSFSLDQFLELKRRPIEQEEALKKSELFGNHQGSEDSLVQSILKSQLATRFPNMDDIVLERAVDQSCSPVALEQTCFRLGIREETFGNKTKAFLLAITTALPKDQGEKFVERWIAKKTVDWDNLLTVFEQPELHLKTVLSQFNTKDSLSTRLLNESGRQSPLPTFHVGLFVGFTKIGEGVGHSFIQAQRRGALDALGRFYKKRTKVLQVGEMSLVPT